MKIQKSIIQKVKLTDLVGLDPVDVILEDIEPGRGNITLRCYTKAWTSYWGAMGDRTIAQFFCDCDEHYIAKNLSAEISPSIADGEALVPVAKKELCKMRRDQDFSKIEARDLWEELGSINDASNAELLYHSATLSPIFGDDWWQA